MSTKIGHFEIQSELSKSLTAIIYKANDPQSGQTVALKAIDLSAFGESAAALEQALQQEAESTNALSCPNLTPVFGAGEMDGKFCAAMEYVQGNSIATMLARKEGFSIWDLLDIGRQVGAGLDYAHSNKVYHFSLEPAKIMCGWDGTVKVLSYGVSSGGRFTQHLAELPSYLHYMSPEQIRGEEIDGRSNLFSLGAMFYEMVTDRKAFDRPDAESLRQSILESTPVPPMHVNAKLHPLLSDLIMKAMDKDPANRYQSGRELLDDLEKCKESKAQAAKKPAAPAPKGSAVSEQAKAAAQAKLGGVPAASTPVPARPAVPKPPAPPPAPPKAAAPAPSTQAPLAPVVARRTEVEARPKAAAAAAGWGQGEAGASSSQESLAPRNFISASVKATLEAAETQSAYMSAAPVEAPEVETFAPGASKITVDPMMAEDGPGRGSSTSFSEISELPPLKEAYVAPAPPPSALSPIPSITATSTMYSGEPEPEEKPKVQPREVAQKAIKEIKAVPPQLLMYSIGGAVALILIIAAVMFFRIHSSDDDAGPSRGPAPEQSAAQPETTQPAPRTQVAPAPVAVQPAAAEPEPEQSTRNTGKGKVAKHKAAPVAAPVVVPGQLALDSTPQGAQVQIDGRGDPSWVTPLSLSNLQPGAHSIIVSKAGYSTDSRSVDVASGGKATLVVHLAQLMATLAVTSDPAGANIYVDGKDMGKLTPAQVSIDKGSHTVLIRKPGYIDETTTAQFALGQTVSISPALRPLGNVDNIKTVGKMKKLFGGNGGQPGQGTVSVRTNPKGAQVAINQHMLDKASPVDVMLDPGNYVVDITLSGYAPLHKVVTVDKGGKVVVDETLAHQ